MDVSVVGIVRREKKTLWEGIEFVVALLPRNKLSRKEILSRERGKMKEKEKN